MQPTIPAQGTIWLDADTNCVYIIGTELKTEPHFAPRDALFCYAKLFTAAPESLCATPGEWDQRAMHLQKLEQPLMGCHNCGKVHTLDLKSRGAAQASCAFCGAGVFQVASACRTHGFHLSPAGPLRYMEIPPPTAAPDPADVARVRTNGPVKVGEA